MQTAWMDEDTEVTPQSSGGFRLRMPLPAPLESVPAPDGLGLDYDDLDLETLPRTAPVAALLEPAPMPTPPTAIPVWALVTSCALLFAAIATTVALVL